MGNRNSKGHVTTEEETAEDNSLPGLIRSLCCGSKRPRKTKTTTRIPVDEYEALHHLKGPELRTLVRSARTDDSFVSVTAMCSANLNEIYTLMSQMRSEEMSLDQVEMDRIVKMGISLNAMNEDVEAFIKPLPDKQTVVIYAFDYSNLKRAVHFIKVRIQRLQTTPEARRKETRKRTAAGGADINRSSENKKEMTKKPGLVRSLSSRSKRSRKIKTTTRIPVDKYEALQHMKGPELSTLVMSARLEGSFVSVTAMSTADFNEINKLMSQMRSEEMSLDQVEMDRIVKMGTSFNAVDEDVEAFIKALPDKQTVVIYAFDYSNLNRAKHYIKVRIQRWQTTPDARRKRNLKKIASDEANVIRSSENKKEMTKKPGLIRSLSCGSKRSRKIKTTTRIPVDEYEALQHMKGPELRTLVRSARTDGSFVSVTAMSTAHLNEINKLMSQMRSEEMSLDQVEMDRIVKMGISINAMDEDVQAFIKPLPDKQKVVIYAFDYTNLNSAKHYIKVRIQRLQTTPDARRKRNLNKIASVEADVNRSSENKYYKGEKGVTTTLPAMSEDPTYLSEDSNNSAQTVHTNNPRNGQELLQEEHELIKLEDKVEYEALTYLIGRDFISAFRAIKDNPTKKSSSEHKYVLDLLDALKKEDVVFSPVEMNTLRNVLDVKTDGVNAFMKTVDFDKIAICAFDYTSMSRAKHLLNMKCGRVKITSGHTVKRTEDGDVGEHFKRYSSKSSSLVTKNDIQVSVYKADITHLIVDTIVNVANENLAHGGGVALAIARAAGHVLEIEGDEYIKTHGRLKVTDVVPTSSGNLPCKKVLHAVGPRWKDYSDKNLCEKHLAQTVFNCFLLADKLHVTSLAMSSISSAIFGVPKHICATMYLAALQRFDYEYGPITTLRHIHFVDISDEMVATIQDTFTEKWNITVKPPEDQRSRTDTYGSEWDWDERAPYSSLEIKEKVSRHHSFPRRVRREETHERWYDVEPLNKKYFPQQSDTRQFDGASPRETGTTQFGVNSPDRHTSSKMLPGGLSNNSSANDKPLRENDHTYGPIRSRSGQTRELDDRNETTSSYVSNNDGNETERYNSANAQSSNHVPGTRELCNCNSSNIQSLSHMHDRNSATNDAHDRNGRYNSATNDAHDRNGRYSSATNDTHDRNGRYNSVSVQVSNKYHQKIGKNSSIHTVV